MEDPLQGIPSLSLFPCNIPLPDGALKSTAGDDLESIHEVLKSMELQSPEKYLEQAKSVLDSYKAPFNPEFTSSLTGNDQQEADAADGKEIPRGRRPGLGRKKAQFTMNPNLSQPSLSSKPVRDEELSKDPKEFFAYFERREMAEKELRRLRGESVSDDIDFNVPRPERHRRPGLGLNRKTVTYKHLYPSSTLSQNDETVTPSQETLEEGLPSPVDHSSQPEAVVSHAEVDNELTGTGSIAESESKVSTLFDELLSRKDLDENGLSSLLLESLQIKPTIIDEIPIPVFRESRLSTRFRTALADIQNTGQTVGGKALAKDKQLANIPLRTFASSPPSTSPLAPISAFQKHIRRSNMSNDLFSALDLSPFRNSSYLEDDEQSNHLDTRIDLIASGSSEMKSMLPEIDDYAVDNLVSSEMITDQTEIDYDISVKDQLNVPEVSNLTRMSADADFGVDVGNEILKNMQVADVGKEAAPSLQVDANVESSSRIYSDCQTAGLDESDENVKVMPPNAETFIDDDSTEERMNEKDDKRDHISPAGGGSSYIAEAIPEQQTQNMEEPSEVQLNDKNTAEIPSAKVPTRRGRKRKEANVPLEVPLNDQAKEVPPEKARKKKEFSRRNSLAGAGTRWEEGKRKSCRIRSRPLEYWKGEKFLYGRVHESLATVIGLKYASPGQNAENRFNEKPKLKVKSYVSSEHEELVKRVSFY